MTIQPNVNVIVNQKKIAQELNNMTNERYIRISNPLAMKKAISYFDEELPEDDYEYNTLRIVEGEDNIYMYIEENESGDVWIFRHASTLDEAIEELLLWHE